MSASSSHFSGLPSDNFGLSPERRERAYRETSDVNGGIHRMIRAVGRRVAEEDPEDLAHLILIDQALREAWATAVAGIRGSGFTDSEIGQVLGVTKQAVQKHWPREKAA